MRYFWPYLRERFPLQVNGLLILSFFTANYLLAAAVTRPGEPLALSWRFPGGYLVLMLMFFHLRVIDEHKDFEPDRIVHPDRILSRGLIGLEQLRRAGLLAVLLELAISYLLGIPAFIICLVLLIISWMIYKEFYAGEQLSRHMLGNAFLHLLVMPLYSIYVFTAVAGRFPWGAPAALLYAFVSYGVGLAYELARKTRAPQDERPGLVTYSRVLGPYIPAFGAVLSLLFSGLLSSVVGSLLDFGPWYHAAVAALLLLVTAGALHFRLRTTTITAARLPIYAGLFIFAFDWLLSAELIRLHGIFLT
jgi:UPF0716 family protein affecting phage T7 exclusion